LRPRAFRPWALAHIDPHRPFGLTTSLISIICPTAHTPFSSHLPAPLPPPPVSPLPLGPYWARQRGGEDDVDIFPVGWSHAKSLPPVPLPPRLSCWSKPRNTFARDCDNDGGKWPTHFPPMERTVPAPVPSRRALGASFTTRPLAEQAPPPPVPSAEYGGLPGPRQRASGGHDCPRR